MSTKIVAARLATSAGVTTVITRSSSPGNIVRIVESSPASQIGSVSDTTAPKSSSLPLHTRFIPDPHPIRDRYFWLLHGLAPHGTLYIDEGAFSAIANKAGLLPAGIVDVEGTFAAQEAVRLVVVDRLVRRASNDANAPAIINGTDTGNEEAAMEAAGLDNSSRTSKAGQDKPNIGTEKRREEVGRALVNYNSVEISRVKGLQSTQIEKVLGYAESDYVAFRENISFFPSSAPSRHREGRTRMGRSVSYGGLASAGLNGDGTVVEGAGSVGGGGGGGGGCEVALEMSRQIDTRVGKEEVELSMRETESSTI